MKRELLFKRFKGQCMLLLLMLTSIAASAQEAYAVYTEQDSTLAFYYDELRSTRPGISYSLNTGENDPDWTGNYGKISQVVFDSSFAAARPTTTRSWFRYMVRLTSISGINYLNTDSVTDMGFMFQSCRRLTALDVSGFNTENVTNMICLFNLCESLTTLDVSGFNTSSVTNMEGMFCVCRRLTTLDVSGFNTENVTNMESIFSLCESLTTLDVSGFNTENVKTIATMFNDCNHLQTIYVGKAWSTNSVTYSYRMFYGCINLVGGQGTTYNGNYVDAARAHIDGGRSNPGYLTEKINILSGDVNADGEVNIADVNSIISVILGNPDIYGGRADVNADGEVNIADVNAVIDCILTGSGV